MDGTTFDNLARSAGKVLTRRGTLGLVLGGVAAAATAGLEGVSARRGKGGKKRKKRRCKKLTHDCGSKKKCCKGLICTDGACACPAGTVASGDACVPQPGQPECTSDAQCGQGQVCHGGECVAAPRECVEDEDCGAANRKCVNGKCVTKVTKECDEDNDCGLNEVCESWESGNVCVCAGSKIGGRCTQICERQADCPGTCSCHNHFPEDAGTIEDGVCTDDPFLLCDAKTCDADSDCQSNELCVSTACSANAVVFKCFPICTA